MSIKAMAEHAKNGRRLVEALVIVATPVRLNYSRALFYGEMWRTLFGSPTLWLLQEITARQIRESWHTGGYRSRHTTGELFDLLNPTQNISALKTLPMLLVYSRRDSVASPDQARAMRRAAPHARFIQSKKASHVMLTLLPEINGQVAAWLCEQLTTDGA